jgi:hypothetical protein
MSIRRKCPQPWEHIENKRPERAFSRRQTWEHAENKPVEKIVRTQNLGDKSSCCDGAIVPETTLLLGTLPIAAAGALAPSTNPPLPLSKTLELRVASAHEIGQNVFYWHCNLRIIVSVCAVVAGEMAPFPAPLLRQSGGDAFRRQP